MSGWTLSTPGAEGCRGSPGSRLLARPSLPTLSLALLPFPLSTAPQRASAARRRKALDARGVPEPGSRARYRPLLWSGLALCFLVYGLLCVRAMEQVDVTVDETTYFNGGHVIQEEGWQHPMVRLHGPIPYVMNQIFVDRFPEGGYDKSNAPDDLLLRGRLGTLPFGLLGLALVFVWSRRLFGPGGGLLSAFLYATSPLLIGYGSLLAVDVIYSACMVLCLFLLWLFALKPTGGRLLLLGLGLGVALATKYLALLFAPWFLLVVAWVAARSQRRRGPMSMVGAGLGASLAVAALAIGTLHVTYRGSSPLASMNPDNYQSRTVSGLIGKPLIGPVLGTFPSFYLLGVDHQLCAGEASNYRPFVDGKFASSHASYYLRAFLWRTPEWVLLLTLWLLLWQVPRWAMGKGPGPERAAFWILAPPMLIVLAYLSLLTGLQIGIRYVLPLYPLLFVLLGALASRAFWGRRPRLTLTLATCVLVLQGYDLTRNWPNLLGYFNHIAGGQALAFRHFKDSNADWGQLKEAGLDLLRKTEQEPFAVLSPLDGPRLGRVAIYVANRVVPDPEQPTRSRHWLDALPLQRNVGAAWWFYEVTADVFAEAAEVAADPRVRAEYVVALIGAGRIGEARRYLGAQECARGEQLEELADLAAKKPVDLDACLRLAGLWRTFGRHDLVERLVRSSSALAADRRGWAILARAQLYQGHVHAWIETMLSRGTARSPGESLKLARALVAFRRYAEALAVLDTVQGGAAAEDYAASIRAERDSYAAFLAALR